MGYLRLELASNHPKETDHASSKQSEGVGFWNYNEAAGRAAKSCV